MNIEWQVSEDDIKKITELISNSTPAVKKRIEQNIEQKNIQIDRNSIIKALLYSLISPVQRNTMNTVISSLFTSEPFLFRYDLIIKAVNLKEYTFNVFKQKGIPQDINKLPEFFSTNFFILESNEWDILSTLKLLIGNSSKITERAVADTIDSQFKGFGAVEARLFLQYLGLSRFEIPIHWMVIEWLNQFGFPIYLSPNALHDRYYYHFISDGIQFLCEIAGTYPCILEAAIYSSTTKNAAMEDIKNV
jgi:hypothetical protein